MYHDDNLLSNYEEWWEGHNNKYSEFDLTKEQFKNFIFKKGFNKGDILFIVGANPEKLKVGDVIIFNAGQRNPIIHRIIEIKNQDGKKVFGTIGDNNNAQIVSSTMDERNIHEDQLMGKAVFKLAPYFGWGKLIIFEHKKRPDQRGFCKEN